jgi:hypothetical protein
MIPSSPAARQRWLDDLRAERTCDTARALIDVAESACADLDETHATCPECTSKIDGLCRDRTALLKVIGELVSRAIAADKHSETLELAGLRERAEAQKRLADRLGGLH